MVEQVECEGFIKFGDIIVEAIFGNIGYSLAMICSLKGYCCVFMVFSKVFQEKLFLLKVMGVEVVVCFVDVVFEDFCFYYFCVKQLFEDIFGAYYLV